MAHRRQSPDPGRSPPAPRNPTASTPHRLSQRTPEFSNSPFGADTLALLFGLYSLIAGVFQIVLNLQLSQSGKIPRSVLDHAAGAGPGPPPAKPS